MSHDVIVIGGGPAGSAAAALLARQGRHVVLVEKAEFPRRKVCGEFVSATSLPVLDRIGVGDVWRERAGPEVRRLALFAGGRTVSAAMPRGGGFGRALGRDVLDTLLARQAALCGAEILQPARVVALHREGGGHAVELRRGGRTETLRAPVVIAAHGSWEPGTLPTQPPRHVGAAGLLGFKAHFRGGHLAADLMPLLAFPGGYGGMVSEGAGRLSLSCCIGRDALARIRRRCEAAGTAMERHLTGTTRGIADVLDGAELVGPWLAAGPIRPGIRKGYDAGVFRAGNAAGEAHPVVAEGISMALQSAWLLARSMEGRDIADPLERDAAGALYAAAWRRQFVTRIRAANVIAGVAMRPGTFGPLARLIAMAPAILTIGARLSGKSTSLSDEFARA